MERARSGNVGPPGLEICISRPGALGVDAVHEFMGTKNSRSSLDGQQFHQF